MKGEGTSTPIPPLCGFARSLAKTPAQPAGVHKPRADDHSTFRAMTASGPNVAVRTCSNVGS